jgi:enolase
MHAQTNITSISAAQRLDSRGKPTVQVRLTTLDGVFQAIVPSGASKGDYEAIELRDGDRNAFEGNGVLTAVHNVESVLGPAIIEKKYDIANDLEAKEKLGAIAVLGISMACTRAAAAANVCPFLMLV